MSALTPPSGTPFVHRLAGRLPHVALLPAEGPAGDPDNPDHRERGAAPWLTAVALITVLFLVLAWGLARGGTPTQSSPVATGVVAGPNPVFGPEIPRLGERVTTTEQSGIDGQAAAAGAAQAQVGSSGGAGNGTLPLELNAATTQQGASPRVGGEQPADGTFAGAAGPVAGGAAPGGAAPAPTGNATPAPTGNATPTSSAAATPAVPQAPGGAITSVVVTSCVRVSLVGTGLEAIGVVVWTNGYRVTGVRILGLTLLNLTTLPSLRVVVPGHGTYAVPPSVKVDVSPCLAL